MTIEFRAPSITIFTRHSPTCKKKHEGESYRRCDCWKHLRYFHPTKKIQIWEKTKQRTWAGAERVRRDVEKKFGKPEPEHEQTKTASVADAVAGLLAQKRGQNISRGVLKKYELELGRFVDFCNERNLLYMSRVTFADLCVYRDGWQAVYPSSTTRQQVQGRLISFYSYCEKAGLVGKNVAKGLSTIKIVRPPTLPLTTEQFSELLEGIPEVFFDQRKRTRIRSLILCMRHTGLAIRDAVCLPRADLRKGLTGKDVVITPRCKNSNEQYVPIPPHIAAELIATPNDAPDYFFWNTGNGTPQTAVTHWQHDLRKLFRHIGMPQGHPHQLRDTFVVSMLDAGVPLEEVSRMIGHKSIRTTEKYYAPWVNSRKRRLEELVGESWERSEMRKTNGGGEPTVAAIEATL